MRRHVEEPPRPGVRSDVQRQEAERRPARTREQAVGDFFLDHDDEAREEVPPPHEGAEHRRRRLVREVSDERYRWNGALGRKGGADVGFEDIGRDDRQGEAGRAGAQGRGEVGVDLERDDARAPRKEPPGQGALPRADLDDRFSPRGADGRDDPLRHARVGEEVLAPARPPP